MKTDFIKVLEEYLKYLDFVDDVELIEDGLNKVAQVEVRFRDFKEEVKRLNLYFSKENSTELMTDLTPDNLPRVVKILNTISGLWDSQLLIDKLESIDGVSCDRNRNEIIVSINDERYLKISDKIEFIGSGNEVALDVITPLSKVLEVLKA